jgi:signal transduction histidine kinase
MDVLSPTAENGRTAAILESLQVAAFLLDCSDVVTHINEAATLIFEIDRHAILGHPFYELNRQNAHYVRICSALRRALGYPPGEQQAEVTLHVRGRDHVYILKPAQLRLEDGSSFGVMVTLHDLTYLRDKERARVNLIATLSNELKTPLTSLSLAIELLQRKTSDPAQLETIDTIIEELARLRDLSDGLLNVARDENTSIAVHNVSFEVATLVSSVVKNFSIQAAQKEVALRIHTAEGIEAYGDPVKLSWVMSNLISNALRYTPEGGSIEVSARRTEQSLRLSVSDTGPGIPFEIREVIFGQHTEWSAEGLESGFAGLGLEIAKEIVEAHGGRIFLETSAEGNTFIVDLPSSRCI